MLENMKAALFDMDGTLIDSMPCWRKLNVAFVVAHGVTPTEEEIQDLYGMSGMLILPYIKEHYGLEFTFDDLEDNACKEMEKLYDAGLPMKPCALEYLKYLKDKGIMVVICTATPAQPALFALNRMGLIPYADYIFNTDLIGTYKGDPEFFNRVCARIGVPKEQCVMFEDAPYAAKGARDAGLGGVVAITDDTNLVEREHLRSIVDVMIDSYAELME